MKRLIALTLFMLYMMCMGYAFYLKAFAKTWKNIFFAVIGGLVLFIVQKILFHLWDNHLKALVNDNVRAVSILLLILINLVIFILYYLLAN